MRPPAIFGIIGFCRVKQGCTFFTFGMILLRRELLKEGNMVKEEKEEQQRKSSGQRILEKPLPQILDEIDAAIDEVGRATLNANRAAAEARKAGEEAGKTAEQRANQVIGKLTEDIDTRFRQLEDRVDVVERKIAGAAAALLGSKKQQ